MDDVRGRTRLITKGNTNYFVLETPAEIQARMDEVDPRRDPTRAWVSVTTITGQALFPPEKLWIRADQIVSLQEVSDQAWTWSSRMNEIHYARQLADMEQTPVDRMIEVQREMVKVLSGEDDE